MLDKLVKLFSLNRNGGMDYASEFDRDRARAADLITLPREINGTNCGNCLYSVKSKSGMECDNPKLHGIAITSRQCCAYWDHQGSIRS